MQDMIQIKIAVEGMKAEIVRAFDVVEISSAIKSATTKAVDDFDMKTFIEKTVESVLNQAREYAIVELSEKYGQRWASELAVKVDEKIEEALHEDSPND